MPVHVAHDPFGTIGNGTGRGLLNHQARLLQILMPTYPGDPPSEWPLLTRSVLRERLGYSPTNSLNRLINGHGSSRGMIDLGLIEIVQVNVEGVIERNYRITRKGIECLIQQEAK